MNTCNAAHRHGSIEPVIEALAHVLAERRRMFDAAEAMGHRDLRELEPCGYREQLVRFSAGVTDTIGSESDPFVLMASTGPIARYYIKAERDRCVVVLTGSELFISTLNQLALGAASNMVH